MPNLFIKTDYWTRAQKPWVKLYVNLFCEEGKLGAGNQQSRHIEGLGILVNSSLQFCFESFLALKA